MNCSRWQYKPCALRGRGTSHSDLPLPAPVTTAERTDMRSLYPTKANRPSCCFVLATLLSFVSATFYTCFHCQMIINPFTWRTSCCHLAKLILTFISSSTSSWILAFSFVPSAFLLSPFAVILQNFCCSLAYALTVLFVRQLIIVTIVHFASPLTFPSHPFLSSCVLFSPVINVLSNTSSFSNFHDFYLSRLLPFHFYHPLADLLLPFCPTLDVPLLSFCQRLTEHISLSNYLRFWADYLPFTFVTLCWPFAVLWLKPCFPLLRPQADLTHLCLALDIPLLP